MISILMSTADSFPDGRLARAVDSVLCQNYTDFELIICDDASCDGTESYLNELAERESRVRILRNSQRMRSDAVSFGRCLNASEPGRPYLLFMWANGALLPNALSALAGQLQGSPELDLVFGSLLRYERDTSYRRLRCPLTFRSGILEPAPILGLLAKKELLERCGWFDASILLGPFAHGDLFHRMLAAGKFELLHRDVAEFFWTTPREMEWQDCAKSRNLAEKYCRLRDADEHFPNFALAPTLPHDRAPKGDWSREEQRALFMRMLEHFLSVGDTAKSVEWSERLRRKVGNLPDWLEDAGSFGLTAGVAAGIVYGYARREDAEAEARALRGEGAALEALLENERAMQRCLHGELQAVRLQLESAEAETAAANARTDSSLAEQQILRIELAAMRHRLVDAINGALKRPPYVHQGLKKLADLSSRLLAGTPKRT